MFNFKYSWLAKKSYQEVLLTTELPQAFAVQVSQMLNKSKLLTFGITFTVFNKENYNVIVLSSC